MAILCLNQALQLRTKPVSVCFWPLYNDQMYRQTHWSIIDWGDSWQKLIQAENLGKCWVRGVVLGDKHFIVLIDLTTSHGSIPIKANIKEEYYWITQKKSAVKYSKPLWKLFSHLVIKGFTFISTSYFCIDWWRSGTCMMWCSCLRICTLLTSFL